MTHLVGLSYQTKQKRKTTKVFFWARSYRRADCAVSPQNEITVSESDKIHLKNKYAKIK